MRRVLLAGVSLTVTACAMSSAPPPAVSSRSTAPSPYVMALAENPAQCTLWREVAGQRQCLDGGVPQAAPQRERPPVAAPRTAVTAQPLDAPRPALVAAPVAASPPVVVQPGPMAAPLAAEDVGQQANLFDEMKRIGMIKASPAAAGGGLPSLPASGGAAETAAVPAALPSLPRSSPIVLAAFEPASGSAARAFAATDPLPAPAARGAAPKMAGTVTQSWATVEPPAPRPVLVQIAASTPQAHDTVGRAPVAAVEKADLPSVRANTVVPLKIAEKATEDRPAVVTPAVAPAATPSRLSAGQVAQTGAPQAVAASSLPALPALPSLPAASAPAAASEPAVPATAAQALPPVPSRVVSAPVAAPPLPAATPSTPPVAEPAKASPLARAMGTPAQSPKPPAGAVAAKAKPAAAERQAKAPAHDMPKSAAGKPAAGRYLVVQSFQERDRADRLAARYHNLDAKVASVTIKGQTWHRVVVRDGASERSRLASDGLRGFWPVTL